MSVTPESMRATCTPAPAPGRAAWLPRLCQEKTLVPAVDRVREVGLRALSAETPRTPGAPARRRSAAAEPCTISLWMEVSTASTVTPGTVTDVTPLSATTALPPATPPATPPARPGWPVAAVAGEPASTAERIMDGAVSAERTRARRFECVAGTRASAGDGAGQSGSTLSIGTPGPGLAARAPGSPRWSSQERPVPGDCSLGGCRTAYGIAGTMPGGMLTRCTAAGGWMSIITPNGAMCQRTPTTDAPSQRR